MDEIYISLVQWLNYIHRIILELLIPEYLLLSKT